MKRLLRGLLSSRAALGAAAACLRKRGRPLYLSVCVHAEKLQEKAVFESMLNLGRALDFRASACVMTPANPFIKAAMEKTGLGEDVFSARLKELSGLFEIGYHGHWCAPADAPAPGARTEIERAGFALTMKSGEAVKAQFLAECGYLAEKLYPPKAYSAGWWYMSPVVAGLLQEACFRTDCSLRLKDADSFGGRYQPVSAMPPAGRPFILPGTKDVLELPSAAYLHLNWWTLLKDLLPMLASSGGPLFAVLPTHDYNLTADGAKVLGNIRFLGSLPNVKFISLSEMRTAGGAADSQKGSL